MVSPLQRRRQPLPPQSSYQTVRPPVAASRRCPSWTCDHLPLVLGVGLRPCHACTWPPYASASCSMACLSADVNRQVLRDFGAPLGPFIPNRMRPCSWGRPPIWLSGLATSGNGVHLVQVELGVDAEHVTSVSPVDGGQLGVAVPDGAGDVHQGPLAARELAVDVPLVDLLDVEPRGCRGVGPRGSGQTGSDPELRGRLPRG